MVDDGCRRTDRWKDGCRLDGYTISSPCEPNGSGELKIIKQFQLKIVIFTAVKNRCIFHGRVFVMKLLFEHQKECFALCECCKNMSVCSFCHMVLICIQKYTLFHLSFKLLSK